jgi:excisionase family DNA binding protein
MSSERSAYTDGREEEVITARVAAEEKGVHPVSVYRAIREGRLRATRSGKTLLIRRRDLAEWHPIGHRPRNGSASETQAPTEPAKLTEEEARRMQIERNKPLVELLRRWREEGDEEEQRQTFEALKQVLNEERKGYRLIYP